jgi:hypothetical protein
VKIPRLLIALAAAAMFAMPAALVHATSEPGIASIDTEGCAGNKVCVTLTVDNPVAGTITLKLTGHTPGSAIFVDLGARLTFTIVPGQTTYTDCFADVSAAIAGQDFNTLRVEFASSDIPNLQGTTVKSVSFPPCATPTPSPTPTPTGTPTPTPSGSPSPTPSGTPTPTPPGSPSPTPGASPPPGSTPTPVASPSGGGGAGAGLAMTGGLDLRFLLAGVLILLAGLAALVVSVVRNRSSQL